MAAASDVPEMMKSKMQRHEDSDALLCPTAACIGAAVKGLEVHARDLL